MAGNRIKTAFKRGFLFLLIPGLLIYIFGITVSIFDSFWSPFFFLIFGKNLFWGAGLLVSLALTLIIGWILTSRLFQGRLITNLTGRLWSKIPLLNLFFGKDFFFQRRPGKNEGGAGRVSVSGLVSNRLYHRQTKNRRRGFVQNIHADRPASGNRNVRIHENHRRKQNHSA